MSETLKFIHASDLHLDVSISGLLELPQHLIEVLANAPYHAATKIVDTAVAERVDFVLLAGDLFDIESNNARSAAFLLNQFRRLNEKGIEVYWVAGCLLYTSDAADDSLRVDLGGRRIIKKKKK